jgi:hypothetical protein
MEENLHTSLIFDAFEGITRFSYVRSLHAPAAKSVQNKRSEIHHGQVATKIS